MKTVDSKVTAEEVKEAVAILFQVVTDTDTKIRYGLQKRAQMQRDLTQGRFLRGYRAEFLMETCDRVLAVITEQAEKFNRLYRHDHISVIDYCDVLRTAIKKLRLTARKTKRSSLT